MISYTILFCLSHAVSNIIIWSGMVSFYSLNRLTCEDFIIWLHFMLQWVGAVTFVNFVKLHRQKSPLTIVSSVSTAHTGVTFKQLSVSNPAKSPVTNLVP